MRVRARAGTGRRTEFRRGWKALACRTTVFPVMAQTQNTAKWALALVAPLLFLAGAEGLLRAGGHGYPTRFLLEADIGRQPSWVDNPFYGYRFFAPELARNPAPIAVARAKPDGVTRVVVLGESAAQGDPLLEFGLPRMLEKMLNTMARTSRYEVVNAAMTAISSPIVADIARETAACRPDLYVVYMGNNEVVGPYGPGTVFTQLNRLSALTPWRVRLTRLRLAQTLRSLADALRTTPGGADAWRGMEMFAGQPFPEGDDRLRPMYRAYAGNVQRIVGTARQQGARVILSTVAVNLVDCPPFASEQSATPEGADVDPRSRNATSVYNLAQARRAQGNQEEARVLFKRARDLDTQRFRADSAINQLVREAARRHRVELVDAESLFESAGPDRAGPGAALFLDHVHFTFAGTWQLAGPLARAILGEPGAVIPTLDECRRQLFFTAGAERQQAALMLERRARPPFAAQPDNVDQMRHLQEIIARANGIMRTQELHHLEAEYRDLAGRDPQDYFLAFRWGQILGENGHWSEAVPVLTNALTRLPLHFETRIPAANALCRAGRPEDAARVLLGASPVYGLYLADYTTQLFRSLQKAGYPEEARRFAQAVLAQAPRFPRRDLVEGL